MIFVIKRTMNWKQPIDTVELKRRQELLETARKTLQLELVGLDEVIDQVLDTMGHWYLFPELQERPLVINLWGMTGVGKTALVVRLAELLGLDDRFFRFDLGAGAPSGEALRETCQRQSGLPCMYLLDEFQHARTLDEDEREISASAVRLIWDLLDSGRFQWSRPNQERSLQQVRQQSLLLKEAIRLGVKAEKGEVIRELATFSALVKEQEEYLEECELATLGYALMRDGKDHHRLLPVSLLRTLYPFFQEEYTSRLAFLKWAGQLDEHTALSLMEKAEQRLCRQERADCSQSLFFVAGNLDEAYTMSRSLNPDMSADEFHEASRRITINHIKKALRYRFRSEQVARLGNHHIIYPAFNEAGFRQLIRLELEKSARQCRQRFGLQLRTTAAFDNLLYAEGVYPAQGTRPLFSTLYRQVNARIPRLLAGLLLKGTLADSLELDYREGRLITRFFREQTLVHEQSETPVLNLEKLREPARDEMQAIVAVHEAGHAVVEIAGRGSIPTEISSTSSDPDSMGHTLSGLKPRCMSRQMLVQRIAECMGGLCAERLVFGEEHATLGAESDLEEATELAARAVRCAGMGRLAAAISVPSIHTRLEWHDQQGVTNEEIAALLEEGRALAVSLLTREKEFFHKLALLLSTERVVRQGVIDKLMWEYGSEGLRQLFRAGERSKFCYRKKLQELL